MDKEYLKWIEQAEKDLSAAEYNFEGNHLETSAVLCQQTVEKAFKAVYIYKNKKLAPKTHDVIFLGEKIGAPQDMIDCISPLTDIYMSYRYPDIKKDNEITKEKVNNLIKSSINVLKWCKEQLY